MLADVPRRRTGEAPELSGGSADDGRSEDARPEGGRADDRRPGGGEAPPQRQLTQRASPELWGRLVYEATRLPHVREGGCSGCADARALVVADRDEPAVPGATLAPGAAVEPVHLHGVTDTSTRLVLPSWRAGQVCADGWGVPRRRTDDATEVLVFGPRDRVELAVVVGLIAESVAFARGGDDAGADDAGAADAGAADDEGDASLGLD